MAGPTVLAAAPSRASGLSPAWTRRVASPQPGGLASFISLWARGTGGEGGGGAPAGPVEPPGEGFGRLQPAVGQDLAVRHVAGARHVAAGEAWARLGRSPGEA